MREHIRRTLLTLSFALAGLAAPSLSAAQPTVRNETMSTTATYRVKEMACHGCAERIHDQLKKRAGVSKVVATLKTQEVSVTFDRTKTNATELKQALDKLGFEAKLISERKDDQKPS